MADMVDTSIALLPLVQQQKVQVTAITATTIGIQHNASDVASEAKVDFEDGPGLAWTVTDDSGNGRVKVTSAGRVVSVVGVDSTADTTNAVTLTTLQSVIVPAGAMGTTGGIEIIAYGYFTGTNSTGQHSFELLFGGTQIATLAQAAPANFVIRAVVVNTSATTQVATYDILQVNTGGPTTVAGITSTQVTASENTASAVTIASKCGTGDALTSVGATMLVVRSLFA